ncbi:MAG: putative molybdenum carrier protein [Desulfobacterales bacterium]
MLKKIISGGQLGADQAALDAAIKYNFPHGGWIQKGRKIKNGILPDKYELEEMPVAGYKERIEQNVIDSDGTVIFSHGELTGGADYSMKMTERHKRPTLHIDLEEMSGFIAASKINTWVIENNIEVLNVAGSRASEDPDIYRNTMYIIEDSILLSLVKAKPGEHLADYDRKELLNKLPIPPKTVDEAVDQVISDLDLKVKIKIANADLNDLLDLRSNLREYFKKFLALWSGNTELLASCRSISKEHVFREDDVTLVIIKALWEKIRETHGLRVVK